MTLITVQHLYRLLHPKINTLYFFIALVEIIILSEKRNVEAIAFSLIYLHFCLVSFVRL